MTAIDLFSGCGGLTLGLKMAGFQVLAGIEIDTKAALTYRLNHGDVSLIEGDIRETDPVALMRSLKIRKGKLDLLAACPPCQGFSRIRTKNGARSNSDPRNDLAMVFLYYAKALKPRHLLLENVPGLRRQPLWQDLIRGLENEGYEIVDGVIDANDYGVAQRRKRLIMLASLGRKPSLPCISNERPTVRDALQNSNISDNNNLHHMRTSHAPHVLDMINRIPKNGGSRSDLPEGLVLPCHKRTSGFSDVYGRMAWSKPAPTITSGCHNPSKGRFLHPDENRAITLREAALLQGFPADYQFETSHGKEAIALMIGNALPPPMICAHAKALVIG
ncbi:DNA cytosine methyltransferase [Xanthomonas euvesicatoria]|uniref:DNA cytosine methyltransferase n=1 Tax=Xanthomonas euvesicatoria TaxID=456327 RepID=UPI001E3C12B1|nr:DNA cytosine methyltransferase [Xanthomonas euvesicatoria]